MQQDGDFSAACVHVVFSSLELIVVVESCCIFRVNEAFSDTV